MNINHSHQIWYLLTRNIWRQRKYTTISKSYKFLSRLKFSQFYRYSFFKRFGEIGYAIVFIPLPPTGPCRFISRLIDHYLRFLADVSKRVPINAGRY